MSLRRPAPQRRALPDLDHHRRAEPDHRDRSHVLAPVISALTIAGRVLTLARERGRRGDEARAVCLLGEVTGRRDPAIHAGDNLRDALALAEELGMRPLVARCHLGLGKLARRACKRQDAQDHLTTAATMCREMGMRFWLEQAETEMRQLR